MFAVGEVDTSGNQARVQVGNGLGVYRENGRIIGFVVENCFPDWVMFQASVIMVRKVRTDIIRKQSRAADLFLDNQE